MPNQTLEILRRSMTQPVAIEPLRGIIEGTPIVFNKRTAIADLFFEEIDPHALDGADLSDVKLMINHMDGMIPLARHRRGKRSTMDIAIDESGMHIKAQLDAEKNINARALLSAVERGDIEDMSFAFGVRVTGEEWRDLDSSMPLRRITAISKVFEVSAVNDGAYPQTEIYARSGALENEKKALENAIAEALENEKRAERDRATLSLQKQKFLFMEEMKHDDKDRQ